MKFVALVSGGKDSCYNSMECVRHGHELVCLANLYPPAAVSDEADSFMYQSAAHTAIEAQAECFGKPLIRRELAGRAVNQSLQYRPTEDDEVEDLFLLLKEVKERFPEVEGVGSGAILSNYQRTRVENVCGRLGLQSLAYLWRRPQSPLLAEMVEAGLDAVLVKVASFGLEPSKHLGRSLARLRPFFESLHSRCGFHVCGEGGEYETLTLDCPLFVRKLVLDETVVVNHSDDMFAPVGLLRVVKCHTEPKPPLSTTTTSGTYQNGNAPAESEAASPSTDAEVDLKSKHDGGQVEGAADLQAAGASTPAAASATRGQDSPSAAETTAAPAVSATPPSAVAAAAAATVGVAAAPGSVTPSSSSQPPSPPVCCLPHVHEGSGGLVYVSGVRGNSSSSSERHASGATAAAAAATAAAEQAAECLAAVRGALEGVGVSFRDVCFVHLYLRDMGHFASVNEEYCKWFQGENPPSRSCVSVPLPSGCSVMLDVVALRGSGEALAKEGAACAQRQVLHVRSISSWAPVCIGPYCQANTLGPGGGIALIAGQIGLQPECMTFPARTPLCLRSLPSASVASASNVGARPIHERELSLCVSHASSVASAVGASVSRGCVFATLYVSQEAATAAAAAAFGSRKKDGGTEGRIRGTTGGGWGIEKEQEAGGNSNNSVDGSHADVTPPDDESGASSTISTTRGDRGWLQGMIDDCRVLMEARCAQEQAEAAAEAAGTGTGGGDDDSAEDGWTSDPEELAKEAARKLVLVRRVPILAVVVPTLPKNATVELEVLCMSRAALSILPCRHYPPTSLVETFSASPIAAAKGQACPVPARFVPPPATSVVSAPASMSTHPDVSTTVSEGNTSNAPVAKEGAGGEGPLEEGEAVFAKVTTTGSTVDRILGVCVSSLAITLGHDSGATPAAATAEGTPPVPTAIATTPHATSTDTDTASTTPLHTATGSACSAPSSPDTKATGRCPSCPLSGAHLERAMSLVLSGVSGAVSAARLRWCDVSSLRVYYRCCPFPTAIATTGEDRAIGKGALREKVAGGMDEELLKRATYLAMAAATRERPAVTFVPVKELEAGAVVSVHATAWSLSRLRTELWVRGAA